MQRLRKLWQDVSFRAGLPGQRLSEYILIAAYSVVAILSLIVGITAKAGTFFGPAAENTNLAARPELKSIMKQLAVASADVSVGASVLVIAVLIVYWRRRGKSTQSEALAPILPSGPPFLL